METKAAHCKEELDLLALLKEVLDLLNDALGSLVGKTPPSLEVEYLGLASNFVNFTARDYVLLRERGSVNGSKFLMRPVIESTIFATAILKEKGLYFRKVVSEKNDEAKLNGEANADLEKRLDRLASDLQKKDPSYPITKDKKGHYLEIGVCKAAELAGMLEMYNNVYRLYCQYTHGTMNAMRGHYDPISDSQDTFFITWFVWQMLHHLENATGVKIPDRTDLTARINRANDAMLMAFGG